MALRSSVIHRGQLVILRMSYVLARFRRGEPSRALVIGVNDVAGLLQNMAAVYPDAVTVKTGGSSFHTWASDVDLTSLRPIAWALRSPWLLGSLAARRDVFVYIGDAGFLLAHSDGREAEFAFLRSKGCHIVCIFTGSDIRSPALTNEFGRRMGREMATTYLPQVTPTVDPQVREAAKRRVAAAADRHADVIVNPPVDQMSYLRRETHPFLYFCPDDLIGPRPEKWRSPVGRLRVVHAPTSPILKGTPIVRAAVKQLQEQGYDFEYVEISNRPHQELIEILEETHIVLNEFYALLPGLLGVEAMACNAVLLTAADRELEPSLDPGANEAWVVTPYWLVHENLRRALDGSFDLQAQADRGTAWVSTYCSQTTCRARLDELVAPVMAAGKERT